MSNVLYNSNILGEQSPASGYTHSVSCNEAISIGFYVDGFNLYYSLLDLCPNKILGTKKHDRNACHYSSCISSQYKWSNLRLFSERILANHRFLATNLKSVKLFTSQPNHTNDNYKRHIQFEKAQKHCGVEIIRGRFDNNKKNGQEKETDINIAINIIDDIVFNNIKKVFLITNDSDFVPLILWIKKRYSDVEIFLYSPHKRATVHHLRVALCEFYNVDQKLLSQNKVSNSDIKIYKASEALLLKCKLPDIIYKQNGKILTQNPYI